METQKEVEQRRANLIEHAINALKFGDPKQAQMILKQIEVINLILKIT